METDRSINDELYRVTVEAKSDAVLSVIGKQILARRSEEIRQSSECPMEFSISYETHEKIASMIKVERRLQIVAQRKERAKKLGKACAIVLLFLGISGTVLINSSEAFRYQFDNFWVEIKTEYLGLKPHGNESGPDSNNMKTLSGLWYPKYLPDGFQYSSMNDMGAVKEVTFSDGNGNIIELSETEASGTSLFLDNEADESGQMKINRSYDGYWAKNDGIIKLVWLQSDHVFQLSANFDLSEIVKIAESMEYKK